MPQDRATAEELLAGVEKFLRNDVLPQLSGSSVYKCRVAANMLSIVQRELAQGPGADKSELEGLEALLGRKSEQDDMQGALDDLNQELCAKIRSGELDDQLEAVVAHTHRTLLEKVGIANPRYAGLPK
ncbi:MAG TPA: hypothetical protein DIT58_15520 [Porticoccaceae bacterium]|nr:hypothetical protein [Porticoccaceae bacterium]